MTDSRPGVRGGVDMTMTVALVGSLLQLYFVLLAASGLLAFALSPPGTKSLLPLGLALSILTAGAILDRIAQASLRDVRNSAAVGRLLADAEARLANAARPPSVESWRATMSSRLSLATPAVSLLIVCAGLIILTVQLLRKDAAQDVWPAVLALMAGQAIYVSWSFERAAMKTELELLAASWAEKTATFPCANLSPVWAGRATQLGGALGCRADRDHGATRP